MRVLNDEDLKKIRVLKMREALKHVTKDDPFKKKVEEEDIDEDDIEFVSDEEEGEIELDEEGEEELEEDDEEGEEEDDDSSDDEEEDKE